MKDSSAFKWIIASLLVVIIGLFADVIVLIDKNEDYREDLQEKDNYVEKNNSVNQNNSNQQSSDNSQINDNTIENNQNNNSEYIGKDKALEIVLDHANLNKNNLYDLDIELERKYSSVVYEIDFKYDRYEYEYYIDATSGEIIHSFKEID